MVCDQAGRSRLDGKSSEDGMHCVSPSSSKAGTVHERRTHCTVRRQAKHVEVKASKNNSATPRRLSSQKDTLHRSTPFNVAGIQARHMVHSWTTETQQLQRRDELTGRKELD